MDKSAKVLSDMIVYTKYAKYLPKQKRRETWGELVTRNRDMHTKKFPELKEEISKAYEYVFRKEVLPSMRSLQFGGKPIEINPSRSYNCAYVAMDSWEAFHETMFLLLGGTGVGYSVQTHHVKKLPEVVGPHHKKSKRYLIGDSIEGWADAIKILMKSYFFGGPRIKFDFSDIRPKGARLVTSGGKAPGPQPLKECIVKLEGVLTDALSVEKLSTIQVHDIQCYIADAVLAGGIRRAAMISFFSIDDRTMLSAKSGTWWERNPQRGRANNSVVMVRSRVKRKDFDEVFTYLQSSGSGEPGFYFTNDKDFLSNPCGEIGLKSSCFCNLTEINASIIHTQEEFNERSKVASFIGTLQASYTDFHFLRSIWEEVTKEEGLLGVSLTGIASNNLETLDAKEAANCAIMENNRVAKILGINPAKRVTTVKPAGTSSIVLGCSSGIHGWHSEYFIRRIRMNKNEAIYKYLEKWHTELVEDEFFSPHDTAVASFPLRAPSNAITRAEGATSLLERVKKVYDSWVLGGHTSGANTHNISATISVKEDEWDTVRNWMWVNRKSYNGISLLPYDGGTYRQAPFEECSLYMYNKLNNLLTEIDFTKIIEEEDNTDLSGEIACGGGSCEIT